MSNEYSSQEGYYEYMMRRMREDDERRKNSNVENKETALYEAARHVNSFAVKWLRDNKKKMHPDDAKNLETSIKVIDIYGMNYYDRKNN